MFIAFSKKKRYLADTILYFIIDKKLTLDPPQTMHAPEGADSQQQVYCYIANDRWRSKLKNFAVLQFEDNFADAKRRLSINFASMNL